MASNNSNINNSFLRYVNDNKDALIIASGKNNDTKIVKLLLDHGSTINFKSGPCDDDVSALFWASVMVVKR